LGDESYFGKMESKGADHLFQRKKCRKKGDEKGGGGGGVARKGREPEPKSRRGDWAHLR